MKDISQVKFYIGPMTQNVIDSVIEVANEKNVKFGFCVSRRQIDYDGGYVGNNSYNFVQYIKSKTNNVIIERDHSGPLQGRENFPMWVDTHSMKCDSAYGFDIIHIDPWKKFTNFNEAIRETVNNILCLNTQNYLTQFEVGTEEAIYPYDATFLYNILHTLQYELGTDVFSKNIRYAVIQSGTSLEETCNTGTFNLQKLKDMTSICKEFGVLSKEHNGDYLTDEEIQTRFENGLNAINIAPEFGVIETTVLLDHIKNDIDFNKIYDICYSGKKWIKWVKHPLTISKNQLIKVCGHYHNKEIKQIINIDDSIIKTKLKEKLYTYINK